MVNRPALMIAAPSSGSGKTTVTAALAALHRRRGLRVKVFKCGPDFIDPQLLEAASGAPVDNLDLWLAGEALCREMLAAAAAEYDLILVEAVMGLFDGAPSAADLAIRFDLPVLAIIDASSMAQTFGALAFGLAHYRPGLRFHGVLANRVAGERHAQMLAESVPAAHWQGWLPRGQAWPERHLGLALPDEIADLPTRLDSLASQIGTQPAAALPPAVDFCAPPSAPLPRLLIGKRIAIARDAAFAFIYPANLDCLIALGAELVFFSPLAHEPLPDADALWLPGGYPELYLAALADHPSIRSDLHDWLAVGKPVLAECGGMLALCETLAARDGDEATLWQILPATATLQPHLAALGLQSADLGAGILRGHTFHYSTLATHLEPIAHATPCRHGSAGEAIYRIGSLTASYVHFWFASNPQATAALFGATL